jgi:hypothetical protein
LFPLSQVVDDIRHTVRFQYDLGPITPCLARKLGAQLRDINPTILSPALACFHKQTQKTPSLTLNAGVEVMVFHAANTSTLLSLATVFGRPLVPWQVITDRVFSSISFIWCICTTAWGTGAANGDEPIDAIFSFTCSLVLGQSDKLCWLPLVPAV